MQIAITGTRGASLLAAAEHVERDGAALGLLLRQSRLSVWEEIDWLNVEELAVVHDRHVAEHYARRYLDGRLSVSDEPGCYETALERYDEILLALRRAVPLESLSIVEASAEELPTIDADSVVTPSTWMGMWFRSQAERMLAQALDRANVLFIPNATAPT